MKNKTADADKMLKRERFLRVYNIFKEIIRSGARVYLFQKTEKGERITPIAREFLSDLDTELARHSAWVKIESEDDLPKESGKYWITTKHRELGEYYFDTNPPDDYDQTGFWMKYFVAYMPIPPKPEPFQEADNETDR